MFVPLCVNHFVLTIYQVFILLLILLLIMCHI